VAFSKSAQTYPPAVISFGLFRSAFLARLLVTGKVSNSFLHFAGGLFGGAFNTIESGPRL
jgi:hypothetical protein